MKTVQCEFLSACFDAGHKLKNNAPCFFPRLIFSAVANNHVFVDLVQLIPLGNVGLQSYLVDNIFVGRFDHFRQIPMLAGGFPMLIPKVL